MIPKSFIQAWSLQAPWPDYSQIEQDLIISRALCDLFNAPQLKGTIAFRGGTAINKLLFKQPLRYSEDIDLVQIEAAPIGTTIDAIRDALAWLGKLQREQAGHSTHLTFKFTPEFSPLTPMKLKVEINTREHANLFGIRKYPFTVRNEWFEGQTEIDSFEPEELFGTKLRALLQRRKNRDLFDLAEGHRQLALDAQKILQCFAFYVDQEGSQISRANAEQRMLEKLTRNITDDVAPLLPNGISFGTAEAIDAFNSVWRDLIIQIPGEAWKLSEEIIAEFQRGRHPNLLRPKEITPIAK